MTAPSSLPGVAPPLFSVSDTNKGGLIVIITALTLCFVLVAFLIRMYVRMAISGFRLDDCVLTAATLFSCVQSAIVFLQVHKGFGTSLELIDPSKILSLEKTAYVTDILYIFALYLSKCCVGFLYLRLTPGRGHNSVAWSIMGASTIWAIISIFLVALRCHPSHPWSDMGVQCQSYFSRWLFIGILDILTEIALFSMSVYLVYGLQMSMKSKAIVVGAFGVRLPVIVAAALHLHYLHLQTLSLNPTLVGTYTIICAQFELGYGIMASSIPCLKPFMSAYEGPLRPPQKSSGGHSGGSYKFTTYGSNHSKKMRSATGGDPDGDDALRPDQAMYRATVSHRDASKKDGGSIDSGDSRQMIIRKDMVIKKEVKWSVERDEVEEKGSDAIVRVTETTP